MTGLSFDLTEEQEQLRQTVRDFANRECPKDVARRLEASKDFPEDLARRIAAVINVGTPERMRYMQDRLPTAVLAAASVTQAPRLTRPV